MVIDNIDDGGLPGGEIAGYDQYCRGIFDERLYFPYLTEVAFEIFEPKRLVKIDQTHIM